MESRCGTSAHSRRQLREAGRERGSRRSSQRMQPRPLTTSASRRFRALSLPRASAGRMAPVSTRGLPPWRASAWASMRCSTQAASSRVSVPASSTQPATAGSGRSCANTTSRTAASVLNVSSAPLRRGSARSRAWMPVTVRPWHAWASSSSGGRRSSMPCVAGSYASSAVAPSVTTCTVDMAAPRRQPPLAAARLQVLAVACVLLRCLCKRRCRAVASMLGCGEVWGCKEAVR